VRFDSCQGEPHFCFIKTTALQLIQQICRQ